MKIVDRELQIALEQVEADSWEQLCRGIPAELAETFKLTVAREDDVVMTHCLVADRPLNNRAIGLGMQRPCTREQIHALARRFIATEMKNFALAMSPYANPTELEQWLAEAGLVIRGHVVKLVRDNAQLAENDTVLQVKEVEPADKMLFGELSARAWERPPIIAHWMCAAVGLPGWRHYLAYDNGQPVAAAAMYIDGHYAWLGIGSTLPQSRGKGAQQSLIARRIQDGLALGVRHFIAETESFNTSCHNLMHFGFECAYERPNYGIPLIEPN